MDRPYNAVAVGWTHQISNKIRQSWSQATIWCDLVELCRSMLNYEWRNKREINNEHCMYYSTATEQHVGLRKWCSPDVLWATRGQKPDAGGLAWAGKTGAAQAQRHVFSECCNTRMDWKKSHHTLSWRFDLNVYTYRFYRLCIHIIELRWLCDRLFSRTFTCSLTCSLVHSCVTRTFTCMFTRSLFTCTHLRLYLDQNISLYLYMYKVKLIFI